MKKLFSFVGGSLCAALLAYVAVVSLYPYCAEGRGVHYGSASAAAEAFTSHLDAGNTPPECLCYAKDAEADRLRAEVAKSGADVTDYNYTEQYGAIHEFTFTDPRLSRYGLEVTSTSFRPWFRISATQFYTAELTEKSS